MESGYYYVGKLKITNFLSFFGNHEVDLLPFTAITCNYPEGKEDMIRATEFVFGANLKEMSIENPKSLVHKALWKEYDEREEVQCFVEVTVNLLSDNENLKFYRGIKKCIVEHKINDKLVSNLDYEEWLSTLNLNIKSKNIILHRSFFYNAIWGTPEDLETVITTILSKKGIDYVANDRVKSCSNEWKKIIAKIEDLREVKNLYSFESILQKIKKSHVIVEKFVDHFNGFLTKRNYFMASIAEEGSMEVLEPSPILPIADKTVGENFNSEQVQILQDEYESLLDIYKALELRENKILWEMYLFELKISSNPLKISIWQERIKSLKEKLKKYEDLLSSLWAETKKVYHRLNEINLEISASLAVLWDLERSHYLKNRLTKYGRLIDYLQPNGFVQLLREILGESTLYGNLCDDMETAVSCLKHLRATSYEGRETFIVFENYSSEFKDLLLATAEDGVHIKTVQDLLIFLCKLKQYGLIATVPVIAEKRFNFEPKEIYTAYSLGKLPDEPEVRPPTMFPEAVTLAKRFEFFPVDIRSKSGKFKLHERGFIIDLEKYFVDDIIYPEDGIFFNSHGLMSYFREIRTDAGIDTETENIVDRINQLVEEQEFKNEEYTSLIFQRFETIRKMITLEDDILRLRKFKRHIPKHVAVSQEMPLPDVYNEFLGNFKACDRRMEFSGEELIESEECLSSDVSGISPYLDDQATARIEDQLNRARMNSNMIEKAKTTVKGKLKKLKTELRQQIRKGISKKVWFQPVEKRFPLQERKKTCSFYYDMELEKCRALMSFDEIDEFESWKLWRMDTINSLGENLGADADLLKIFKRELDNLAKTRKRTLAPLLEHCNENLSSAINFVMGTSLPFLHLQMDQNGLQLLSSLSRNGDSITEIDHFNTFMKFLVGLSLFLEIANYDNVPLLLLDNLQEFLPMHKDSYEGDLGNASSNKHVSSDGNINFQVITRIANYLNFFIEKNKHNIGENGKKGNYGPLQIIYFTSDDLVHGAQCHLWIRNNLLPDEYITELCDSYSAIEEIKFE